MPELPDVVLYVEHLGRRIAGAVLTAARVASPNLLRTAEPPLEEAVGRRVQEVHRRGKRIVLGFEGDLFLVFHLMIAGRFRWREAGAKLPGKIGLAVFEFSTGSLVLTEAGTRKRASLHVIRGREALASMDAGGLEVLGATLEQFRTALLAENHTLKRS